MGVSRIGILFAANVDSLKGRNKQIEEQKAGRADDARSNRDEAVVVSNSMTSSGPSPEQEDRSARVKQLQDQIRRNSYKVDSLKLALSVARDLA